jgi:chemotaxis response regulator CheB
MGDAHAGAVTVAPTQPTGVVQRVLVVDDSRAVQVTLTPFLTRMGYQVEIASNGWVAVKSVRRARPDVIIMDVEMPLMVALRRPPVFVPSRAIATSMSYS